MANTYTQLYVQLVFAVKGRENIIDLAWENILHRYIGGIVNEKGNKNIIINGMTDHVHAVVGLSPVLSISDLVREMKNNSSAFINKKKLVRGKFYWQDGYGAFSYSKNDLDRVFKYVQNQKLHHRKVTFREEYLSLLSEFEVSYDNRYLFEWYE